MAITHSNRLSIVFRVIISVLLLSSVIPDSVQAQTATFKRQSVNMKLDKGHFLVSGMYFLTGNPGEKSTFSLQFPTGSAYGEIDSLHVYDVTKAMVITADSQDKKRATYSVVLDESGESLVQTFYLLKLTGSRAEYPFSLDSGKYFKLEKACFYLIAPVSMNVSKFNYTPKDTIDAGANVVYYWEMHDFTPTSSFEFRFNPDAAVTR